MTNDKTVIMSRELAQEWLSYMRASDSPQLKIWANLLGASLAAPVVERQERCPCCGTHEVSLERTCHNSSCEKYADAETIHEGWKTSPPAPVSVAPFKLISLPPSLMQHHAFDVLQDELASVGVKIKDLIQNP